MNLSLVDPFILAQDYPETLAGHLRTWRPVSREPAKSKLMVLEMNRKWTCDLPTIQSLRGVSSLGPG